MKIYSTSLAINNLQIQTMSSHQTCKDDRPSRPGLPGGQCAPHTGWSPSRGQRGAVSQWPSACSPLSHQDSLTCSRRRTVECPSQKTEKNPTGKPISPNTPPKHNARYGVVCPVWIFMKKIYIKNVVGSPRRERQVERESQAKHI